MISDDEARALWWEIIPMAEEHAAAQDRGSDTSGGTDLEKLTAAPLPRGKRQSRCSLHFIFSLSARPTICSAASASASNPISFT